jgi:ATP-dependent Zn protease
LINALLAELDGAVPRDGVVVIGATNHPDRVDPALKRPGRLERTVEIPLPDFSEIGAIIKHHLSSPIGDGMLSEAALACRGMSPAAIAMLCREARRAARRRADPVVPHDVMQAAWEARPKRDDADDMATCRHEAAHAVAAVVLGLRLVSAQVDGKPHCETIFSSIHATRDYTERFVVMLLAARRADAMLGDGVTAGAVADLAQATETARCAVARWGLTGSVYAHGETEATLDRDVRADVKDMLDDCDLRAAKLVDAHREAILRVAEALRVRRFLDAEEVKEIVLPSKSPS